MQPFTLEEIDAPAAELGPRRPHPFPKTAGSRRRVPRSGPALAALDALAPRLDTPLLFHAPEGGHISLANWRTREWYDALDAAGLARRGPEHLRHTFATEALAAGVSAFQLARVMGTSIAMIDRTYGHLAATPRSRSGPTSTREWNVLTFSGV